MKPMKPFERVFSKLGYIKAERLQEIGPLIGSYITATMQGLSVMPDKSYSQLVDAYKSWVYTCVDKIGKAVAMIPLGLYVYREERKKSGRKVVELGWRHEYKSLSSKEKVYFLKDAGFKKEQIRSHSFLDLINHPNSFMTRFMLWYETMIRMELGGICGWFLPPNALGLPGQIFPLPLTKTATLRPKVTASMQLLSWEYTDGTVQQNFKPEEVLPMKYPHPASPFHAMSPLMSQTYPYDIDLFLMQQQSALFSNMAVPGLHLWTEQKLQKPEVKEIKEQVDDQFTSAIKAGKTLVTHSGLKAERLAGTSREAMIDEVARFAREKLITAFDLSEGKLGLVRDVNRANMEALDKTFIMECLRPKCLLIEEVLETFLLPRYDEALTCDFELPDVTEKAMELQERKENLQNLLTTINEEREWIGLEPVDWGDRPWIPFTLTQIGKATAPPPPMPGKMEERIERKAMTVDFWTEEKKEAVWKVFVARSQAHEQMLVGPVRTYFRGLEGEVIERLQASSKKILGQYAGWCRAKILAHLPINKDVRGINIDKRLERKRLRELMKPLVKIILKEAGDDRLKMLQEAFKFQTEFNVNDPAVLEWLGERMRLFSEEVTNTTFDEISAILREGFAAGVPVSTIAETLREKFESWDQYRAPLMARTETMAGMNQADLEAVAQTGLEDALLKHWLTAGDEHVRPDHQVAGREYADGIPIDENFVVGKGGEQDEMESPCNGKVASQNINCRCTLYYTEVEA